MTTRATQTQLETLAVAIEASYEWGSRPSAMDHVLEAERVLGVKADNVGQLADELYAFMNSGGSEISDMADYLYGALVLGIEA